MTTTLAHAGILAVGLLGLAGCSSGLPDIFRDGGGRAADSASTDSTAGSEATWPNGTGGEDSSGSGSSGIVGSQADGESAVSSGSGSGGDGSSSGFGTRSDGGSTSGGNGSGSGSSSGASSGGRDDAGMDASGRLDAAADDAGDGDTEGAVDASTGRACPSCAPSGLVCERYAGPVCLDPNWAEWPMPNGQVDVAAGAPNLESYTDNGDGTVTDNVTGLVWQQVPPSGTYSQAEALSYCAGLGLAGYTGWRLPSIVELISLSDPGAPIPSINATYFPGTPSTLFWSSTPLAGTPGSAWNVLDGTSWSSGPVSIASNVRCVR